MYISRISTFYEKGNMVGLLDRPPGTDVSWFFFVSLQSFCISRCFFKLLCGHFVVLRLLIVVLVSVGFLCLFVVILGIFRVVFVSL